MCGSCWAFAVTGALESYFLRTGGAESEADFSEQAVLSCSGAGGCKGGNRPDASEYLRSVGAPPDEDFPYEEREAPCSPAEGWEQRVQRIGGFRSVSRKLADIKGALYRYGPLTTRLTVYEDFVHFKGGGVYVHVPAGAAAAKNPVDRLVRQVFKDFFRKLDQPLGRHAVLIIGYDDDEKAFIIKNSWDPTWGEDGYGRVAYSQMRNSVRFGEETLAFTTPEEGPELTVAAPEDGEAVGGPVKVSGAVSKPSDLEFKLGDAPYERISETRVDGDWSLDLGELSPGRHEISLRARDDTGGRSETSRRFVVETPPAADETGP